MFSWISDLVLEARVLCCDVGFKDGVSADLNITEMGSSYGITLILLPPIFVNPLIECHNRKLANILAYF